MLQVRILSGVRNARKETDVKVLVVLCDETRDGHAVVYHDDVEVWSDHLAHVDQYLRFYAPVKEEVIVEVV